MGLSLARDGAGKSRFRLKYVQVGRPDRLSRLLMALTIALCWLALLVFAQPGAFSPQRQAAIAQWGRVSFVFLALVYLDALQDWPLSCQPIAHNEVGMCQWIAPGSTRSPFSLRRDWAIL
jgi:hypothetical protein